MNEKTKRLHYNTCIMIDSGRNMTCEVKRLELLFKCVALPLLRCEGGVPRYRMNTTCFGPRKTMKNFAAIPRTPTPYRTPPHLEVSIISVFAGNPKIERQAQ